MHCPPDATTILQKALASTLDPDDEKLVTAADDALVEFHHGAALQRCDWVMSTEDGPLTNTAHRGAIKELVAVAESNYTYNNLSQLLSVLHQVGASTIDGSTYTVDPAGNRTAKTDQHANVTSNYTYDPLYELTQVTQSTTTTEKYSFDAAGNRLSSLGLTPYTINASNELTSIPGITYTYDSNGNTLTKVVGSNTTSYVWDFENRLTNATLPGTGGTVAFQYDPFGRRIYKSSSSGTSLYAYDIDNLIEETNSSGAMVAQYAQNFNIDEPLAMLRSSATSYYHADGLGSVTSLSNAAGSLAQTYTYDSYGKQTASSGSLTNAFQFTSRESDAETGLYFVRARYYDPATGRFVSEDPSVFEGGMNFYPYVDNNPINWFDPYGLQKRKSRQKPKPPADPCPKEKRCFQLVGWSAGQCRTRPRHDKNVDVHDGGEGRRLDAASPRSQHASEQSIRRQ
jgi:RHS repeat-associated protein